MENKQKVLSTSFIDIMMDAVFAVDVDARIVYASAACERIFGYAPEEMIGRTMSDMIVPDDIERTRQSTYDVMAGRPQLDFENRYIRKDGRIVHVMWSARWSEVDQLRIGVARDITEYKKAETMQALLYSISEAAFATSDLRTLFQRIHQIIATLIPADNFSVTLYDKETAELSFPYHIDEFEPINKSAKPAIGTLCAEIVRTGRPLLLTPATMAARLKDLGVALAISPYCWLGVPLKSHLGTIGVLVVKSYPGGACYDAKDQELLQFVSTQIALAIERHHFQLRLQYMAQYDQLTGLPNRGLLYDRMKVALLNARRDHKQLAVLYIDLDKFKQINDTLGHDVGDVLLQQVAQRLKECVRESDTVARVGGDEFVILLQHISALDQATMVAEKIRKKFDQPLSVLGQSLRTTPSIGIAIYPEHGNDEQQLLRHADKAMYFFKGKAGH
tara:strand:- start:303018 stop:304355 length:1338 start_codon:yes stop_codon:yes gene_type:complete